MALNEAKIEEAAAWILQARSSGKPFGPIPEACRPGTIPEGMAIAERIAEQGRRRTVAWKAGFSAPGQMADLGVETPAWGRLFEGMLYDSPATLSAAKFRQPLMEAEIAFRLAAGLPAREGGYSTAEVLDAVDSAVLAIEGADVRFADGLAAGLPSIVADSFAAQSLVVGPDVPDWRTRDLNAVGVSLLVGGEPKGEAFTGDMRCRPIEVLVLLANDLTRRGIGLEAGQVITTGAAATPHLAKAGETIVARFDGIGEVTAELGE